VTKRSSAARYARALLDVSRKEGDPRTAERDLAAFVTLAERHDALARALVHPSIPAARKTALVSELLRRAPLSAAVAKLLVLLAGRDRLALLADLLDEYRRRLLEYERVVRADVTTAVPLTADRLQALERALADATGRTVSMTAQVDGSIIGGVVARVGSVVYDGSVKRQLEKMRETLTAT
jgi:F-type H+-transporting ATPase subunit delta